MSAVPFTREISWDDYIAARPPYPPSMWKLWLDYHQGPLRVVHDVGAGGGIASNDLASQPGMERIYVSDPGKEHLDFAEKTLTKRHPGVKFVFKNTIAEDSWVDDGVLDLVCCCEALHWVDVSKGMPVMANSLRPGGTFAALYYLPFPEIRNSDKAQKAQRRLLEDFEKSVSDASVPGEGWRRGFCNSNSGMDFVPFGNNVWADVRRIEINLNGKDWPSSASIAKRFGEAPSCVEPNCLKERWEDDGWKKTASVESLRQILVNFLGAPEETWQSDAWKEVLEGAKEVGDELELAFQVAMVLARKR